MLRLCLLIDYFLLQASSFDDHFHINGTFRGKLAIFHAIFSIKLTKLSIILG